MSRWFFVVTAIAAMFDADQKSMAFAENAGTYSTSNHDFALSLYTKLAETETGNMIYSPLSIHVIMFLVSIGAASKTFDEIITAIRLSNVKYHSANDYTSMLQRITHDHDSLKLATTMFVDKAFDVKDSFQANLMLSVYRANFKNNPEVCRQNINNWVANRTDQKIKDLFPKGTIDANTVLVLANAAHFKSPWAYKFNEINEEPFYSYANHNVKRQPVKMMTLRRDLQYYRDVDLKFSAVELPYDFHSFKMMILLPDAKDGLASLEKILLNINLNDISRKMNQFHVTVKLPNFKIEQSLNLKDTMIQLGCHTMFTYKANFSGISDKGGLYVSNLVHKAYIDVNENGTEAAGATGGSVTLLSLPIPRTKVQFTADHPFMFSIISQYNDIIFIGRVLHV